MRVISEGIVDGVIQDSYGKRGTQFSAHGVPSRSLPFEILDPPAGARSYAFVLEDKDAVPVTRGFSWIHWTGCNLADTRVEEDASSRHPAFVQGLNSWTSVQGGSLPPEACCAVVTDVPLDTAVPQFGLEEADRLAAWIDEDRKKEGEGVC